MWCCSRARACYRDAGLRQCPWSCTCGSRLLLQRLHPILPCTSPCRYGYRIQPTACDLFLQLQPMTVAAPALPLCPRRLSQHPPTQAVLRAPVRPAQGTASGPRLPWRALPAQPPAPSRRPTPPPALARKPPPAAAGIPCCPPHMLPPPPPHPSSQRCQPLAAPTADSSFGSTSLHRLASARPCIQATCSWSSW